MALTAALLTASLALAGCSGGGSDDGDSKSKSDNGRAAAPQAPGYAKEEGAKNGAAGEQQRQNPTSAAKPPKIGQSNIIRTATLTVRVKDVPTALGDARTAVENAGGYVGDESTDRDAKGHERSRIVLRVPQEEYQSVLDKLAGSGKLLVRKVNEKDVTDQVVDVDSRIKSQQASVARVREMMDRATKLSDVVTLEGELSTRQANLEALKAQQSSLKDRTSMSTITLALTETGVKPQAADDDETSFTDALGGGWDAFVTTVRWIAVALGAVLPFAVALALILLLWRTVRSRLPRRAPRTAAAPWSPMPPRPVTIPGPVNEPDPAPAPERGPERDED